MPRGASQLAKNLSQLHALCQRPSQENKAFAEETVPAMQANLSSRLPKSKNQLSFLSQDIYKNTGYSFQLKLKFRI